jgi:pyruvate formate lyase activating enzyme
MITNHNNEELIAYVFDIQGLSVHDGPGCRTLIFLSGCTLNCFWCSNPEGINRNPVPLHFISKCIDCGNCIKNCDKNAIKKNGNELVFLREICIKCDEQKCVDNCYTDSLKLSAYKISLSKLLSIIQRDRQFWGSKGGITLTGGEPLLQIEFVRELLKQCFESYIHTAIETCGNIPFKNFQQVIPYLDWIFFDLKHFNTAIHKKGTNADNELIIENAKQLSKDFDGRIIFRLPLIPNFNDSEENLNSIISFLKEVKQNEINVLPLHHLGREKYKLLNREYSGLEFQTPSQKDLEKIKNKFSENNIICYLGSSTPF